jgi:hypothetical protein
VLFPGIREQTGGMESVRCPVVVGRGAELEALRSALAEAEAARGGVVVLAGRQASASRVCWVSWLR